MFLCVLMLCTFDFDVVTAVCQLLINGYVILCYVSVSLRKQSAIGVNDCIALCVRMGDTLNIKSKRSLLLESVLYMYV